VCQSGEQQAVIEYGADARERGVQDAGRGEFELTKRAFDRSRLKQERFGKGKQIGSVWTPKEEQYGAGIVAEEWPGGRTGHRGQTGKRPR
jgi:hypothetical protein